jgi:GcrA cell cycle regulator
MISRNRKTESTMEENEENQGHESHGQETWTDERIEVLKKLWSEEFSASQIAAVLKVTRNSVIGKVHRLGLNRTTLGPRKPKPMQMASDRPVEAKPAPIPAPAPAPAPESVPVPAPEEAAVPEPDRVVDSAPVEPIRPYEPLRELGIPPSKRVTIQDLRSNSCRWPHGDPQSPDFTFCGAKAAPGAAYCINHARIAFVPSKEKARKPVNY